MAAPDIKSAAKVLAVLDVLLLNFAYGFSPKELIEETGFSGADITRYVNTLVQCGYAERITETGRIRPSHRFAQQAVQILKSMDTAAERIKESQNRINRG